MKRFILLKNKISYSIDKILNNEFNDKYKPGVLTLPAIPYLIYIVNLFATIYVEFFYPRRGIKKLIFDYNKRGERSRWIIDHEEYIELGKKIMSSKNFIARIKRDFKEVSGKFYKLVAKLEEDGINKNDFYKDYLKFIELYITEYAVNYSVTGPMTLGYGDIIASDLLDKYKNFSSIKKAIKIFAKPRKNFLSQEKDDLYKIVSIIKKRNFEITALRTLQKKNREVYKKLREHQQRYYWVNNNYKDVKYLDLNYFFKRLKYALNHYEKDGEIINNFKKVNDIYRNIEKGDIQILKTLGEIAELHDLRKKANLIANYWLLEFLKVISLKTKIPYSLLQCASLWETLDLLNGKKINLNKLNQRKTGCILVNLAGGKEYWLTGKDYNEFRRRVEKIINVNSGGSSVKGYVANHGKARGRVSIVLDVNKESYKIKKGDILVTSMTRPEFMLVIRLASAIITDEGGITSHAAIISRELGIPCIVGTKNATQVLKDGDLVEVDANKGVVKILKRKP